MSYSITRRMGLAVSAMAMASLTACGGGSAGGGVISTPAPTPVPVPTPSPAPAPAPAPTPTPTPSCEPNCDPVPPPSGYVITSIGDQPQRSANDTAEFRENYIAKEYTNALFAVDNGWKGQGVLVGVFDDGVLEIGDLEGQVSELSKDFGGTLVGGVLQERNLVGDETSDHGTAVAAIIAGKADGTGTMGYAPDAQIVGLRVQATDEDSGEEYTGFNGTDALAYAAEIGLQVINRSLASNGTASPPWQEAMTEYGRTGGLVISSAGNDAAASPSDHIDVTAENEKAWLFVAALETNQTEYKLAAYSNACGTMMNRCVTAPGTNISIDVTGKLKDFSGTSSSAPVVSGLAATILSKWPQLSGQEAGEVIMATAKDLGEKGVDPIFGHGLVDFQAALEPVEPTLSNGSVQTSLAGASAAVPAAMGSGNIQTALASVTVVDIFGRDYTGDLSKLVVQPASADAHWMGRRIETQANAGSASFAANGISGQIAYAGFRYGAEQNEVDRQLVNAEFSLTHGKMTYSAGYATLDSVQDTMMGLAPVSDAMLAHNPVADQSFSVKRRIGAGSLGLSLHTGDNEVSSTNAATVSMARGPATVKLGYIDEQGSMFGTPTGTGAMRLGDGAQTTFVEGASNLVFGDWSLAAYASASRTKLALASDTLMTDADTLFAVRFGLIASKMVSGGKISFGLAQPLTVVDGKATFTLGNGYNLATRSLTFEDRIVELGGSIAPRAIAGYEGFTSNGLMLRFGTSSSSDGRDVRAVGSIGSRF